MKWRRREQEEEMDNRQEVGLLGSLGTFLTLDSWRPQAIITEGQRCNQYHSLVTSVISREFSFL